MNVDLEKSVSETTINNSQKCLELEKLRTHLTLRVLHAYKMHTEVVGANMQWVHKRLVEHYKNCNNANCNAMYGKLGELKCL